MNTEPVLSVSHLSAGYGDHVTVADVSFTLNRGEILCLAGESGCGKSTLLKAVISAREVNLSSGEICLYGTSLTSLPFKQRRRLCSEKMGMVFQNPGGAFNTIRSYKKQFVETLKSHGKYKAEAFVRQVGQVFSKVELRDENRILSQCPYALSGGMNQRTSFALAMLLGQDILLCDEPTSALDATIQLQVAEELKKLRDESGVTQIIVTHNLALASFVADRIGIMYAGRLVELGKAKELLKNPKHPYTRSLIAAIPGLDGRMPLGLSGQPPLNGPEETGCEFCDRCPCAAQDCEHREYKLQEVEDGHYSACCREGGSL